MTRLAFIFDEAQCPSGALKLSLLTCLKLRRFNYSGVGRFDSQLLTRFTIFKKYWGKAHNSSQWHLFEIIVFLGSRMRSAQWFGGISGCYWFEKNKKKDMRAFDVRSYWKFAFLENRDVALACPTDKKYFFFQFYGVISIRVASVPSLSSDQLRKNYSSLQF